MRQIFLDTETTGLSCKDGDRLLEIACVEWIDGKPSGRVLHHYINPDQEITDESVEIHGLTSEFLADFPLFEEVADELIEFVTGAEVIIHNAPFDLGFLDTELRMAGIETLFSHYCGKVTCSLAFFRRKYPGQRNSIVALCERADISDVADDDECAALADAKILAQLWSKLGPIPMPENGG